MTDFSVMADEMISGIHKNMMKYISNGDLVRINVKGGYCNIRKEELVNYYNKIDIDK